MKYEQIQVQLCELQKQMDILKVCIGEQNVKMKELIQKNIIFQQFIIQNISSNCAEEFKKLLKNPLFFTQE